MPNCIFLIPNLFYVHSLFISFHFFFALGTNLNLSVSIARFALGLHRIEWIHNIQCVEGKRGNVIEKNHRATCSVYGDLQLHWEHSSAAHIDDGERNELRFNWKYFELNQCRTLYFSFSVCVQWWDLCFLFILVSCDFVCGLYVLLKEIDFANFTVT